MDAAPQLTGAGFRVLRKEPTVQECDARKDAIDSKAWTTANFSRYYLPAIKQFEFNQHKNHLLWKLQQR